MKKIIRWVVLQVGVLCASQLFAQTVSTRREAIPALAFAYFQGTAQYLDNVGMVEGASTSPSLTGIGNVTLPDQAVATKFSVCGQDNANDQEFSASLFRKNTVVTTPPFTAPQLMAQVNSGVAFTSTATVCPTVAIPSSLGTVNNSAWTYYVELTIGDTTTVMVARITYTCTLGGTC